MTIFHCDGFEAYGDDTSTGANIEALIEATNDQSFQNVSGGHAGGNVSLIDDFEAVGFALQFPDLQSARAEYVRYDNPDGTTRHADYIVATDASAPVLCAGFRFYNASITPASTITVTIFGGMNSTSGAAFTVRVNSDGETLELVDNDGTVHSASETMAQDTWYYIEVEWKQTTDANGGYGKVYLNGTEVIDTGTVDMAGFTFFSTQGFRIGVGCAGGNQTGGNNFAFDDVYCMEIDGVEHTAPLGACRVFAMRPNSDATPNDWTPSTGGDNYALVDDTDIDTSDYVDATTTADDDHYGLTGLDSVTTVHALRVDVACVAVDGTPTLHIGFDDGTADEENVGVVATGSTQNFKETFEEDPSNTAWTESSAEAIEVTQRMTE